MILRLLAASVGSHEVRLTPTRKLTLCIPCSLPFFSNEPQQKNMRKNVVERAQKRRKRVSAMNKLLKSLTLGEPTRMHARTEPRSYRRKAYLSRWKILSLYMRKDTLNPASAMCEANKKKGKMKRSQSALNDEKNPNEERKRKI